MRIILIATAFLSIINLSHASSSYIEKFSYKGQVVTLNNVELISQVSGYITKRRVSDGDYVNEGDVLFIIEKQPYEHKVEKSKGELLKAKAVFDQADGDLHRGRTLFEMKSISKAEIDRLDALRTSRYGEYKIAESNLALAQYELSKTEILSPQSGYIGNINYREGSYVKSEEDVLGVLRILNPVYINFEMSYEDYKLFKAATQQNQGSTTEVYLDNNRHVSVLLIYDSREVNRMTGGVLMRASIDNVSGDIIPGEYGSISMVVKAVGIPENGKDKSLLSMNSSVKQGANK